MIGQQESILYASIDNISIEQIIINLTPTQLQDGAIVFSIAILEENFLFSHRPFSFTIRVISQEPLPHIINAGMPEPPSIIPSINDRLTKIQNESQLLKIVSVMLSAKVYKKISWNSMLLHFRNELAMKARKIKGYKARKF